MVTWIDPPSGWKYGFPKTWDGKSNIMEWLVQNGYPKKEIDSLGNNFFYRAWQEEIDIPPHTD